MKVNNKTKKIKCEKITNCNKNNKGKKIWDYIVFTVQNNRQKEVFELELKKKIKNLKFPQNTEYIIIPDGENKSIGSGGAFLKAIKEITQKNNSIEWMENKKILLINAGGEAKRILEYSLLGKLFLPSPKKNNKFECGSLIEDIIVSSSLLGSKIGNRSFNGKFRCFNFNE